MLLIYQQHYVDNFNIKKFKILKLCKPNNVVHHILTHWLLHNIIHYQGKAGGTPGLGRRETCSTNDKQKRRCWALKE